MLSAFGGPPIEIHCPIGGIGIGTPGTWTSIELDIAKPAIFVKFFQL